MNYRFGILVLIFTIAFSEPALAILDGIFGNDKLPVKEGEFVKIQKGKWRPAKILEIKKENNIYLIRVTYVGLSSKDDEWIEMSRAFKIQ